VLDRGNGRIVSDLPHDLPKTRSAAPAPGTLVDDGAGGAYWDHAPPVIRLPAGNCAPCLALGPAVVAMAVPIWERRSLILANWFVLAAVIAMSLVFAVGNLYLLRGLLGDDLARALTVKSVTAPVAISIAHGAGLREHLALVGVMMSGMFGMVVGPLLLSWFGSRGDRPDLGIALGCAAHGLGTARAFEIGPTAGAFASVSMGLSALSYGVLLPPILSLV
jgi:putative effector of murein hydrolase